ncbi:hypothetical protein MRX96_032991 [Rhipicephalus microplus]
MEGEERKVKDPDPQTCRMEKIKERSRSRSKHRRQSKGRAGSFPRLPKRQEGELPPMTGPVTERTSSSAVLNSGRPTSPNRKVGWGERASQDERDEEMFTIRDLRGDPTPISDIAEWCDGVLRTVKEATEVVETEEDNEVVDSRLVNL